MWFHYRNEGGSDVRIILVTLLVAVTGLPVSAATLDQTFEDDTWDEAPDLTLAEAITALREVHPYLADVRNLDMIRTHRGRGYSGHGLEVIVPVGGYRGFGPYARLPETVDEAWFRYYVFLDDFYPVSSGKLPGLADASLAPTAKGCNPSTPENPGWSGRLMFDTVASNGVVPIGLYLYHLDQAGDCGDEMMFPVGLAQQRWTCIEGHVRMNTPGQTDGMIEAWVDGERVLRREALAFRRPGEAVGVREMWDNVYFGGRYATPNQLDLTLDDIAVSDTGRVSCIDPFSDDNGSVHEGALTELYARQLLFGCGDRLACPQDPLTRAEFAAMVRRLVGTPNGPDAFSDDDGHWGEGALNSLAAAGIMRGCNPPDNTLACPNAQITRAEVAALIRRALVLPGGADAFSDDDGHWAEGDIDALAAAGITRGCDEAGYCPDRPMLRQEAATFTVRSDDRLRSLQVLAPLPEWPPPHPPPPIPPEEQE